MIRREIKGIDGKIIIELIPETPEDEAELERMEKAGELDARDGFSEDPDAWDEDSEE